MTTFFLMFYLASPGQTLQATHDLIASKPGSSLALLACHWPLADSRVVAVKAGWHWPLADSRVVAVKIACIRL
jgi:hypothetical protein